ncbi:ABC transporter permease [Fervidibacillus albus]|uniref:ABC transporter permease n=1 Tax=Fervidibacillus albus TaxID=2980026 RepID=A0A9E8LUT8_9BACI|nr:ABC transporter permease [Fervidibacillus albus]WAA10093.1 ABC transporter permease [Fervidibacillus albus]
MTEMIYSIKAEFVKFKGMFIRYYIDSISEIVSYGLLMFGLILTVFQNLTGTNEQIFQLMVGIFIWYIGINAIAVFSFILREEMVLGTLEQIAITKVPIEKMLLGRAIGTFIFDSLGAIVLSIISFSFVAIFRDLSLETFFSLHFSIPSLIIVILLTMVSIYGFSFILAGFSLVFKRIGAITTLLNYLFLFLIGLVMASNQLPPTIDLVTKLLPMTWGVINLKQVIIHSKTLVELVSTYEFWLLILNSGLYFFIGLSLFKLLFNISIKNGKLSSY